MTEVVVQRLAARVVAGKDGARVVSWAPYDMSALVSLPVSTPHDVGRAFERARQAQRVWAETSVAERKKIMLRFHDLVLARRDQILDLMQAESGKARRDAFLEVLDIAATALYYARVADALLRPRRHRGAFPLLTRTTELRHPKGVVAVISPWNYPLSPGAGDSIAALMAGNAVVQKPDTQTALTALWAAERMSESGLPEGLWQMVIGRGASIGAPR